MSAWVTIGLMLASILGGGILQLVLVGFYFGGRFQRYDAYGSRIEGLGRELQKLDRAFAAHTGVANGYKYEGD